LIAAIVPATISLNIPATAQGFVTGQAVGLFRARAVHERLAAIDGMYENVR
jgi:hypothetical protein